MKLSAMLVVVLAATLAFARDTDGYSALYRGGSLNIVAVADPRGYAWEQAARSGVRFRIDADSIVVTHKKATVVIPFNAITKISCGSETHSATGRKVAATMLLGLGGGAIMGLGGAIATSGATDTDTFVALTWGVNNDAALFQFDKKDYVAVLLALESKSRRMPIDAAHPPSNDGKQAKSSNSAPAPATRDALVKTVNAQFVKQSIVGYGEISGDTLTVHSEMASGMRFHMALADETFMASLKATQIAKFVYTNDADQNFVYDVRAAQVVTTAQASAAAAEPSPDPQVQVMQPTDKPAPEKPCKSWVLDDTNVLTCIER